MRKDLQKKGDGLMIYYTKKECKYNNYEAGDLLDVADAVLIKHQEASENVSGECLEWYWPALCIPDT